VRYRLLELIPGEENERTYDDREYIYTPTSDLKHKFIGFVNAFKRYWDWLEERNLERIAAEREKHVDTLEDIDGS
jgi:hypothetical protein